MCFCLSPLRKHLKLKINRLKAKSLQILSSISSTPCKTSENKTSAVFDRILQPKGACALVEINTTLISILK